MQVKKTLYLKNTRTFYKNQEGFVIDRLGLGKRIGLVRRENNLTAEQLSELCGVQPITIRQIEGGTRLPSVEVLVKLCNTLHVSPGYLLGDSLGHNERDTLDDLCKVIGELTPMQIEKMKPIIAAVIESMK